MNRLQSLLQRFTLNYQKKENGVFGLTWFPFLDDHYSRESLYQGIVFSCIDVISTRASSIDYALVKAQPGDETLTLDPDDKRIDDDPIIRLFRRPNKLQTSSVFFRLLYTYFALQNEVFIWPIPSMNKSGVAELILLNPQHITHDKGDSNYEPIKSWTYRNAGKERTFKPDELIHIVNPNPYNPYRGVSPIEKARHEIEGELNAKKWNGQFFKNGGTPSGIMKVNARTQDEFNMIERKIKEKWTGEDNAFKIFVINKDADFMSVTPTQRDMEFVMQQNMSEKRIHKMFKVPDIFLGDTEAAKYSNAGVAKIIFNEVVIEPMLKLTYDTLNYTLLPRFKNSKGKKLKYANPVPEDFEQTMKEKENVRKDDELAMKYMTFNEFRLSKELPKVEDGDIPYEAYLRSFGGSVSLPNDTTKHFITKAISTPESFIKKRNRYLDAKEAIYREDLLPHYDALVELIKKKKVKTIKKKDESDPLVSEYASMIYPDTQAWKDVFVEITFDDEYEVMKQSLDDTTLAFKLPGTFTLQNTGAIEWLTGHVSATADSVNNTLYTRVREVIARNLSEQVTDIAKIKDEVVQTLQDEREWRVDRVVRNELVTAYSESSKRAYEMSGIVETLEWYTAEDERVCPICGPNHGVEVKPNETFPSGHSNSPAHIMCRCTVVPKKLKGD